MSNAKQIENMKTQIKANPVSFQQKYGSVTINSLINYKESLAKKANRLNESFSDYMKEFYGL
jgi:hypothetical protein